MVSRKSPYLENDWRLADIIAAIQVMGAYPWASRKVERWTEKLGKSLSAEDWSIVFGEHPEFFRLNDSWASLRWRHGYDRTYDPEKGRELTETELDALDQGAREALTRKTLSAEQIEALMKTSVELHNRAIAHAQEKRWLTPMLFGLLGVIIGAVLQAALK
jgi:hypothetical protein